MAATARCFAFLGGTNQTNAISWCAIAASYRSTASTGPQTPPSPRGLLGFCHKGRGRSKTVRRLLSVVRSLPQRGERQQFSDAPSECFPAVRAFNAQMGSPENPERRSRQIWRRSGKVLFAHCEPADTIKHIPEHFGCQRFRLAPDSVAGVAAEVHRHLRSEYGLDVADGARSTRGVRPTTCSTLIVGRECRRKHHAKPLEKCIVRPRTARMLSGRTLKPFEGEPHRRHHGGLGQRRTARRTGL